MNLLPTAALGSVLREVRRAEEPIPSKSYRQIGVRLWGEGAYEREPLDGSATKYRELYRAEANDVIVNKICARNGSVAVVPEALAGSYGSSEFPMFEIDSSSAHYRWLHWLTKTKAFWNQCDLKSRGTSGKNRIRPERFLEIEVPLPPLAEQRRIAQVLDSIAERTGVARVLRSETMVKADAIMMASLNQIAVKTQGEKRPIALCSKMSTGTTPPSDQIEYYGGQLKWYTPADLNNRPELGPSRRTLSEAAVRDGKARVFLADTVLVVAIGGSLGKVGLTSERCSANQQITGIVFDTTVLPIYGYWWMRHLAAALRAAAPQATLPIINQTRIGKFDILIPPLAEQRRIVAYLDNLQAWISRLKEAQTKSRFAIDAMASAVLNSAFGGGL